MSFVCNILLFLHHEKDHSIHFIACCCDLMLKSAVGLSKIPCGAADKLCHILFILEEIFETGDHRGATFLYLCHQLIQNENNGC